MDFEYFSMSRNCLYDVISSCYDSSKLMQYKNLALRKMRFSEFVKAKKNLDKWSNSIHFSVGWISFDVSEKHILGNFNNCLYCLSYFAPSYI